MTGFAIGSRCSRRNSRRAMPGSHWLVRRPSPRRKRAAARPLADRHSAPICHPDGWQPDGDRMVTNVQELRPKGSDTEKITINLGYVDLGQVDLMVREGFYSNRTDF